MNSRLGMGLAYLRASRWRWGSVRRGEVGLVRLATLNVYKSLVELPLVYP
jgi:hypothetical protein